MVILVYKLKAFPVWGSDRKTAILALDAYSEEVTEPIFCQGDRPKVHLDYTRVLGVLLPLSRVDMWKNVSLAATGLH